MKKIIISVLVLLCLISSVIAPPPVPFPVSGKVMIDGQGLSGKDVELTNLYTRETLISTTDGGGNYIVDMGWFKLDYTTSTNAARSDILEIRVCETDYASCVKEVPLLKDLDFIRVNFELGNNPPVISFQCWDGSLVTDIKLCPYTTTIKKTTIPTTTTTTTLSPVKKYTCEDNTVVANKDDCDDKGNVFIIVSALLGVVALGLGALYAWDKVKFKWAKGFIGLMNYRVNKAKQLYADGDKEKAQKELDTAVKMATTVLNKYIKK